MPVMFADPIMTELAKQEIKERRDINATEKQELIDQIYMLDPIADVNPDDAVIYLKDFETRSDLSAEQKAEIEKFVWLIQTRKSHSNYPKKLMFKNTAIRSLKNGQKPISILMRMVVLDLPRVFAFLIKRRAEASFELKPNYVPPPTQHSWLM